MQALAKLKQRDIALIAIGVTVLLIIIWYFSFYSPVRADVDARNSELSDLKTQVSTAEAIAGQVPQLQKAVADLKLQQDEFSRSLPKTQEIGNLVRDLQGNLASSGAEILSLTQTPGTASGLPGVQAIGISMTLRSTFNSLYQSLKSLEGMQRYSNVDNLTVSLQGDPDSLNPKLGSTMAMTVYTFDPTVTSATGVPPSTPGAAPAAGNTAPAAPAPATPAPATPAPASPAPAPTGGRS